MDLHKILNLSCQYTYLPVIDLNKDARFCLLRARIMMKINILVDRYTDSLSFKFYEDPSIGCGEIAKTKLSMHTYHF